MQPMFLSLSPSVRDCDPGHSIAAGKTGLRLDDHLAPGRQYPAGGPIVDQAALHGFLSLFVIWVSFARVTCMPEDDRGLSEGRSTKRG